MKKPVQSGGGKHGELLLMLLGIYYLWHLISPLIHSNFICGCTHCSFGILSEKVAVFVSADYYLSRNGLPTSLEPVQFDQPVREHK